MKRQLRPLALLCALCVCLAASLPAAEADGGIDVSALYRKADVNDSLQGAVEVTLAEDGSFSAADETGITAEDGVLRFTREGTWRLSGSWSGRLEVAAGENDKVRLILDGLHIRSAEGPAIYEASADKLILTLAPGSSNSLSDSSAMTVDGDEIAAALFAEDDLSINGSGALEVSGNVKHGIVSRADLVIANGELRVTALKDGIRGKNSLLVLDGQLTVSSGGDCLCATRSDKTGKGNLVVAGGTLQLNAGGGAGEAAQTGAAGWGWRRGWDDWGSGKDESGDSAKGLKAAADLIVCGGDIRIDSLDDALHGVNVTVCGGSVSAKTGDDGAHADETLTLSGGSLSITQSCEGLEGRYIVLSGCSVSVIASDDGVNATDGSGSEGWNMFAAQDCGITISGGSLYVSADGDGLDSNGSIMMRGGSVTVSGSTNGGNAAVDYNGSFDLSGGTLIATGAIGMMQHVSSASGQAALLVCAGEMQAAGSELCVTDADGNVLLQAVPDKAYQCVLVSCPEMQPGSSCTVSSSGSVLFSDSLSSAVQTGGTDAGGWGNGGWGWGDQRRPGWQTPPGDGQTPPDGGQPGRRR